MGDHLQADMPFQGDALRELMTGAGIPFEQLLFVAIILGVVTAAAGILITAQWAAKAEQQAGLSRIPLEHLVTQAPRSQLTRKLGASRRKQGTKRPGWELTANDMDVDVRLPDLGLKIRTQPAHLCSSASTPCSGYFDAAADCNCSTAVLEQFIPTTPLQPTPTKAPGSDQALDVATGRPTTIFELFTELRGAFEDQQQHGPDVSFKEPADSFARLDNQIRRLLEHYAQEAKDEWRLLSQMDDSHSTCSIGGDNDQFGLMLMSWHHGKEHVYSHDNRSHSWLVCLQGAVQEVQLNRPTGASYAAAGRSQAARGNTEPSSPHTKDIPVRHLHAGQSSYLKDNMVIRADDSTVDPAASAVTLHLNCNKMQSCPLAPPRSLDSLADPEAFTSCEGVFSYLQEGMCKHDCMGGVGIMQGDVCAMPASPSSNCSNCSNCGLAAAAHSLKGSHARGMLEDGAIGAGACGDDDDDGYAPEYVVEWL